MSIPGETMMEKMFSVATSRTKPSILEVAAERLHAPKDTVHGDPERNLAEIAAKWSVTFGVPVTPMQVAIAMIDLKTVRAKNNPGYRDNWVDIVGYAGLVEATGLLAD